MTIGGTPKAPTNALDPRLRGDDDFDSDPDFDPDFAVRGHGPLLHPLFCRGIGELP